MVCHALNESKIISLGDEFANVTISALPTFHVASPVDDSSTSDPTDHFKYFQLVIFEGLTDRQTHTMIFDAFFASCNEHDRVRFKYLTKGIQTNNAIALAGLTPIRTGPSQLYTAMAFTSGLATAQPHPNRTVPHYLELYGITDVCKALTQLVIDEKAKFSERFEFDEPDCNCVVSYAKPNFKSDTAFGRAHWQSKSHGGSVKGSGKGGKGKGGKGKGGERRFSKSTSDHHLYPPLPLWHFTLSTTDDSPLAQLIAHSFSDNTNLLIQCPLSKIHSDKDGFRANISINVSTSMPALELKHSKLRS